MTRVNLNLNFELQKKYKSIQSLSLNHLVIMTTDFDSLWLSNIFLIQCKGRKKKLIV